VYIHLPWVLGLLGHRIDAARVRREAHSFKQGSKQGETPVERRSKRGTACHAERWLRSISRALGRGRLSRVLDLRFDLVFRPLF